MLGALPAAEECAILFSFKTVLDVRVLGNLAIKLCHFFLFLLLYEGGVLFKCLGVFLALFLFYSVKGQIFVIEVTGELFGSSACGLAA